MAHHASPRTLDDGEADVACRRPSHPQTDERRSESRASGATYNPPASYRNLDEVSGEPPIQNPEEQSLRVTTSRDYSFAGGHGGYHRVGSVVSSNDTSSRRVRRHSSSRQSGYDVPDVYANLGELAAISPVQNPDEDPIYRHDALEDTRSLERVYTRDRDQKAQEQESRPLDGAPEALPETETVGEVSRLATQIYTLSYLVLFSILGTLARLGLKALTNYPGAPIIFPSAWPNLAGSFFMGFLSEDRMLFRDELGTPTYDLEIVKARESQNDEERSSSPSGDVVNLAAAKKAHLATKKTIPLYIGLATGFCGSFTSFSSFVRDMFLAMSNDLVSPDIQNPASRNGGFDFMALVAVLILTMTLSLSALFVGAHLAIALEPFTPSLPYSFTRSVLDRLAVFLAMGCWLGAILLSVFPPDRFTVPFALESWRGHATVAISFAPLGCLGRFYLALWLNGKSLCFPLGTFAANLTGTAVLGLAWDLQHAPVGGVVGCQIWQGIMYGFCGCLTTVSTFVAELTGLRRRNAYIYGGASIGAALALLVAIMGGLRWNKGFSDPVCIR